MMKFVLHLCILILSCLALAYTTLFTNNTNNTRIPSSPNYLLLLQQIYLSTTINLQVLIFCFDLLACLFHLYYSSIFARCRIRSRAYTPYERPDFSTLCLTQLFFFIVKPIPLILLLIFLIQGYAVLSEAISRFQYEEQDKPVVEVMRTYASQAMAATAINALLFFIYLLYCAINCFNTGRELSKPQEAEPAPPIQAQAQINFQALEMEDYDTKRNVALYED